MIKDKLHTISDEDAITTALILLKDYDNYNFTVEKVTSSPYNMYDGCDAEESVTVVFNRTVKNEDLKKRNYTDGLTRVILYESTRYRDHPYFMILSKDFGTDKPGYKDWFCSNYIEAVEFLQSKGLV